MSISRSRAEWPISRPLAGLHLGGVAKAPAHGGGEPRGRLSQVRMRLRWKHAARSFGRNPGSEFWQFQTSNTDYTVPDLQFGGLGSYVG